MQASNAPSKSPVAFAEGGSKNTIPVASQIGVSPGAASFTDGFPPLTMTPVTAGGIPPFGQDFNGILYFLSAAVRWTQAGGGYPFDAAFVAAVGGYPKGARILSNDSLTIWVSQVDNNAVDPNAGASASWRALASLTSPTFSGTPAAPTATAGTNTTQIATTAFVQTALAGASTPAGAMLMTFANAAPAGYLKANGAAVSVATYPALAAAIYVGDANNATTLWGYRCTDPANPSTTRSTTGAYIVLPDARGEFFRGFDDGRGVDAGRVWAAWQKATLVAADSTGTTSPAVRSVMNGDDNTAALIGRIGGDLVQVSDYGSLVSSSTSSTGSIAFDAQQNFGTRPRNLAPLVCIKY
ncbi:hypothetical protein CEG14_05775 [Bordetella genomosp. 1]|uniref:Phage tail collar domain-containing protein n=1 Tax=Bordetella genomosp. 1 TaxID=1395607 RepID=A0A261SRY0_9BORD|nr:phage tail protein [Bordetella genomosp. 1]OZI39043.1 hypothetical protein CEG14_05775 [Bordetella genomosp. 1]